MGGVKNRHVVTSILRPGSQVPPVTIRRLSDEPNCGSVCCYYYTSTPPYPLVIGRPSQAADSVLRADNTIVLLNHDSMMTCTP
jgi:hypothetical protein